MILCASVPSWARNYVTAGVSNDALVFVETEQLKNCVGLYPLVCIKWIKHYKQQKDFGLEKPVMSEGMDSFASCERKNFILTSEKRYNADGQDGPETIKVVNLAKPMKKGADFTAYLKTLRAEIVEPNSAAAIAVDFACNWADANK